MLQSYLNDANSFGYKQPAITVRRGFDPNKIEQHFDFLMLLFDKMTPKEKANTSVSITSELVSNFIWEFTLDRLYEFSMATYLRYTSIEEIKNSTIRYSLANHSCSAYELLELMTFTPIAAAIQVHRPNITFEKVLAQPAIYRDFNYQLQYLYDHTKGILPDSDTILSQIYNRKKDKNRYEEKILGDISTPSPMFQQNITSVDFDLAADVWHFDPCVGRGISLLTTKKYFVNILNIDEKKVLDKLIGYDNDLSRCYLASAILDQKQLTSSRIYYKDSTKEHLTNMSVVYIAGNPPYVDNTKKKGPLYDAFLYNASKITPKYQSWIIPSSWFDATDKQLSSFRIWLFKQGLKKIIMNNWGDFEAKINTCIVFCESGYSGDIEIQFSDNSTFSYDFRKLGYLTNAKSLTELLLLVRNRPAKGWIFSRPKNKKPEEFTSMSNTEFTDSTKIVTKIFNDGRVNYGFVNKNEVSDWAGDKDHRLIIPLLRSGEEPCTYRLATVQYIPPGSILTDKYKYVIVDSEEEANSLKVFLQSPYVTFILARTWATRKADNTQLKFIPMLSKKSKLSTNQDVYKYFNLTPSEITTIEQEENARLESIRKRKNNRKK